ncbi:hypothetical protein [Thermoplasma acidophilum]|uniref:Uncharacterized protein n=2 Tax=Thermoplasma acidophilum TaxID=2303 RepID=Q9HLG6_THEAC|nr:hypothetical protein [Thermoplasma acidophilum]
MVKIMNDKMKELVRLSSESSALDRDIIEKQLEIKKRIMRVSGLISLYRIKKGSDPPVELLKIRDRLFNEYMKK